MSAARWRALTLLWELGQAGTVCKVEMSAARLRALTLECGDCRQHHQKVEMSAARLRALTPCNGISFSRGV